MDQSVSQLKRSTITKCHFEQECSFVGSKWVVKTIYHLEGNIGPLALANLLRGLEQTAAAIAETHTQVQANLPVQEVDQAVEQEVIQPHAEEKEPAPPQPVDLPFVAAEELQPPHDGGDTVVMINGPRHCGAIDLNVLQGAVGQQQFEEIKQNFQQIWDHYGYCNFRSFTSNQKYKLMFPPLRPDKHVADIYAPGEMSHDFPICSCPSYRYGNYRWQHSRHGRRIGGCKHVRMFLNVLDIPFENFQWLNKDDTVHEYATQLVNGFFDED